MPALILVHSKKWSMALCSCSWKCWLQSVREYLKMQSFSDTPGENNNDISFYLFVCCCFFSFSLQDFCFLSSRTFFSGRKQPNGGKDTSLRLVCSKALFFFLIKTLCLATKLSGCISLSTLGFDHCPWQYNHMTLHVHYNSKHSWHRHHVPASFHVSAVICHVTCSWNNKSPWSIFATLSSFYHMMFWQYKHVSC